MAVRTTADPIHSLIRDRGESLNLPAVGCSAYLGWTPGCLTRVRGSDCVCRRLAAPCPRSLRSGESDSRGSPLGAMCECAQISSLQTTEYSIIEQSAQADGSSLKAQFTGHGAKRHEIWALPPYGVMGKTCVVPRKVLTATQRLSRVNVMSWIYNTTQPS